MGIHSINFFEDSEIDEQCWRFPTKSSQFQSRDTDALSRKLLRTLFWFKFGMCNFLVILVFMEVSFHPGLHFERRLHKSALEKSTWAGVSWDDLLWSPFCALLFLLIHRLTYYFYVYTIIDRDSSLLSAFLYPGHSVILTVLWHLHENKKPYI